ncbi:RNA polymerase factor sigma-54 [Aquisalibacillus elongatus]|uniref:RNA polymerase RpoN-/SigL-like sigma 54 subunit n=1 Tax=Aquisalibacillus elongatus TaxID=485577 RepID=A0A3N5B504_9BACI|nr:RNA polymerase factor sigma-54 [Aquisalibacillus elongatus]RPF52189.1 RNA polymerase RpoN-/SigL-like sigma 54 subunit [Aquisalibacillus elongatus]
MLNLVVEQKQKIVMTQNLKQAISLLQYSTYDLYQFIHEQHLENPLIEIEETEQYFGNKLSTVNTSNTIEEIVSDEKGMQEMLIEQINELNMSHSMKHILYYLVHNLDENGYLEVGNHELKQLLKINDDILVTAINHLQGLEPVGVGSRDLRECLYLQACYYFPDDCLLQKLVTNHLEDLASRDLRKISDCLNSDILEIENAFSQIQELNPKPCSHLNYINENWIPDIEVKFENNQLIVKLVDDYLPKISFSEKNARLLKTLENQKDYYHRSYQNFKWLLNSIEQRRMTLLSITKAIISIQKEFFEHGISALNPLTMKEVADEIGVHESTISRATKNKVIRTPVGLFDMRVFFSSKLASLDGEFVSREKVKVRMREIISEENKEKPYSDQKISDIFAKEGIEVSRRAVSKYREELNIPSSRNRKQF